MSENRMRLLRSFRFAFQGAAYLLRTQTNALIHLAAALIVIGTGCFLVLSHIEWALIILCIAVVWTAEAFNTAVETLANRVTLELDPMIKTAKDVSAAATLFAAMGAVGVGMFVFGPKIISLLESHRL